MGEPLKIKRIEDMSRLSWLEHVITEASLMTRSIRLHSILMNWMCFPLQDWQSPPSYKGGHILLWRWVPLPLQTGRGNVPPTTKNWHELNWPDLTWFSRIFDLILMAFWLQKCNIFTLSWQRWCSNFHGFLNPNFDGYWIDFWIRSENIDFVKIVLPPAQEHDF